MTSWTHKHILDLAHFSIEDYKTVFELASRFRALPISGARKVPALQGRLITTLFFEPSTRTRSSFELAAKRLSADVQSLSVASSAISKGESPIDTAMTYVSMGADILIVRHKSTNVPEQIANYLAENNSNAAVLNGGDGLHSHPSQALIDIYTLANYFQPESPSTSALNKKTITIVGDILHSRVARSNLWALTACGANVILCGPSTLLPDDFTKFVDEPPPGQKIDPLENRGKITIARTLQEAFADTDAVMTLRLQKERMNQNLVSSLERYHKDYGVSHKTLEFCKKNVPVLHPGPVNRGVEITSRLVEDDSICLIDKQVSNGIPIRMALLYLLSAGKQ